MNSHAFCPVPSKGASIVAAASRSGIRLFDLTSGSNLQTIQAKTNFTCVAWDVCKGSYLYGGEYQKFLCHRFSAIY